MSFATFVKDMFKGVTAPIDILQDWAEEPLKRWENNRTQANLDRDVEREIKKQTGVEEVKSRLKREEAEYESNLHIRMQTEIERLNAQTRQWEADQDAARRIKLLDAFKKYQTELMAMNTSAILAIGEMHLELKSKAQALVLEKTKEYKALQDEAQKQAEAEIDNIEQKYANNQRIKDMMLNATEVKLVGIMNNCARFIDELSDDIKEMNKNINMLTTKGQEHIQQVLTNTLQVKPNTLNLGGNIEDAKVIE